MQTYLAALFFVIASLVIGRAICSACWNADSWWAAPAVGLATLIVLAGAAVKLPGAATTAAVICALALIVAAVLLVRRRLLPLTGRDAVVAIVALAGASLPFISVGRIGVLGAGIDNDMAVHLVWAEALRSSRMAHLWNVVNASPGPPYNGYPLGPHSVVAALGAATGMSLDSVFTGLMLAIIVLIALVAANLMADQALWRGLVVGLACSLTYLLAAFYGEGAFKETIMALLLVAFVAHLEQLRDRWAPVSVKSRWRLLAPAVLLGAGAVYNYSYLGLTWFAAIVAVWGAAEVVRRPALLTSWRSRERAATVWPWLAVSAGVGILLLLPIAGQTLSFYRSYGVSPAAGALARQNLGNLAGPLSPYEGLGLWMAADFRHPPINGFHAGELSALALAVLLFGAYWAIRRRDLVLPAAVGGCAVIWWYSNQTQSPYVAAKALAIASPLVVALGLRALLTYRERDRQGNILCLAAAALFCGFAAYSSLLTLRNEPLQAPEGETELQSFAHVIGHQPVLFLGVDDFAPWQLRQAAVTTLSPPSLTQGQATWRPNKPFVGGQALDFDSVAPGDLDHFRYVVTTSSSYASVPPANFHVLRSAQLYTLWQRNGPTMTRSVFEATGAPGAILDCRTSKLGKAHGSAAVIAQPLVLPGFYLKPGQATEVRFGLPSGTWELSLQYFSDVNIEVSVQGRAWTTPAYLGRSGPYFRVGTLTGQGIASQISVRITAGRPTFLTGGDLGADITGVTATRLPHVDQVVPLSQACGKYVDWYRLS